jgi:hypothetical protein
MSEKWTPLLVTTALVLPVFLWALRDRDGFSGRVIRVCAVCLAMLIVVPGAVVLITGATLPATTFLVVAASVIVVTIALEAVPATRRMVGTAVERRRRRGFSRPA